MVATLATLAMLRTRRCFGIVAGGHACKHGVFLVATHFENRNRSRWNRGIRKLCQERGYCRNSNPKSSWYEPQIRSMQDMAVSFWRVNHSQSILGCATPKFKTDLIGTSRTTAIWRCCLLFLQAHSPHAHWPHWPASDNGHLVQWLGFRAQNFSTALGLGWFSCTLVGFSKPLTMRTVRVTIPNWPNRVKMVKHGNGRDPACGGFLLTLW